MPDIYHDFPIKAPRNRVFEAVTTSSGLDTWWTKGAAGEPQMGAEYKLSFGPEYDWRAKVTRYVKDSEFELMMTDADSDWLSTYVGFRLSERSSATWVQFYHKGWSASNEHFRISSNCWALYLRILRRLLECGEAVPYEQRLEA